MKLNIPYMDTNEHMMNFMGSNRVSGVMGLLLITGVLGPALCRWFLFRES